MTRVNFTVLGHAEPAGSKRIVPIRGKGGGWAGGGRVIDANPHVLGWKNEVAAAARVAMEQQGIVELVEGPLGLALAFTMPRPKGHFGSGRNAGVVKDSAPDYPCVKPDATKLLRGAEDAMTGIVWRDDAQVVEQFVSKRYGEPERVQVTVWSL